MHLFFFFSHRNNDNGALILSVARDCVRSLIANTSGYLYRPDYEYAHLRTEPPCQHPEYSAYSKKQMREMREEERRRKREGDRVEAVALAFVRPDVEVMDVSAIDSFGAAMTDEVEDAASSLLPNIQRLSVIGDLDSEDEDGKEESGTCVQSFLSLA